MDEISKKRVERELNTVSEAASTVGAAVSSAVSSLPQDFGLAAFNAALVKAGLPEATLHLIGLPMGFLTTAATTLAKMDAPDDAIRSALVIGIPGELCACGDSNCYRSKERVQQVQRVLSYAVDEIACLIHGEPEGDLAEDQLVEFIDKATTVATTMLCMIVDGGIHRAFSV